MLRNVKDKAESDDGLRSIKSELAVKFLRYSEGSEPEINRYNRLIIMVKLS